MKSKFLFIISLLNLNFSIKSAEAVEIKSKVQILKNIKSLDKFLKINRMALVLFYDNTDLQSTLAISAFRLASIFHTDKTKFIRVNVKDEQDFKSENNIEFEPAIFAYYNGQKIGSFLRKNIDHKLNIEEFAENIALLLDALLAIQDKFLVKELVIIGN